MKTKIAINGFGRIGRQFFQIAFTNPEFEFVAINDLGDMENMAYLLKYDTVYGRFSQSVEFKKENDKNYLTVGGQDILYVSEKDPLKLPWKDLGIDIVIEASGVFASEEKAGAHLKAGAKRVVITAPAKGDVPHLILGANEDKFQKGNFGSITCNASCTTNSIVPVAAIMSENPGIFKGTLTTIHAFTATQNLVDGPVKEGKDFRRGRAAGSNIVPSTTGAAEAVKKSLPQLDEIFDGTSIRVPVISGSLSDFTFLAKRKITVEEINNIFRQKAKDELWKPILAVTEEQLVSSDILRRPYGAIVDLTLTKVIDGDLVKVFSWYDNEWGYSITLLGHVLRIAKNL
ncbi:MAG: type I glyceraldehyde-3-phosphate dehydrogenase [Parcubacteria group bacterium]|nr:type I glyceraldehyde-3-phosphate dehydrogenase [Parcubacteria group bacterium]